MTRPPLRQRRLTIGCALGTLAALSACGGGGGGGGGAPPIISTPAPVPTPSPSPAPPPPPPPPVAASSFDTAEFRRSDGPSFHGATAAWTKGVTGAGVKIGVVDSGIDPDNPEFAGRIDPASGDVVASRGVEGPDDHGTQVALVAAAARNDSGVVGIAYQSTVVALRADSLGSCDGEDGCTFSDRSIAAGIDRAVAAGATVVNLSLGGDAPTSVMLDAVRRASAAGVVIVVSSGNEGDGSDPEVDPNQPNPFAAGVRNAGGGNVIIAGSVNETSQFSPFSNKAGAQAQWFLSALGERVCCVYENGVLKVESTPEGQFVTLVSGTSFSAPQISGAVALLKQAFPNLTGAQMVDLLLSSARDEGAAGTDTTYGRGILDIAAAFAPRGTTTLAGSSTSMALGDDTGVGSGPMGDAFGGKPLGTVVLDGYQRAYSYDLGRGMRSAGLQPKLLGAVDAGTRQVSGGGPAVAMAFTLADGSRGEPNWIAPLRLSAEDARAARVLAGRVAMKIAPDQQIGFAFKERADGLVAQLQGQDRPAFLIAGDAGADAGFTQGGDLAVAYRRQIGPWGVTASSEQGRAWLGNLRIEDGRLEGARESRGLSNWSLAADRTFGPVETALGLSWLSEDRTILGAYFADAFGGGGANTLFIDASAGWRMGDGWRLGGAFRQGFTRADRVGLIGGGSNLVSRGWSADLTKQGVLGSDTLGLRVSQPLRVEGGGLNLTLPVGYDYTTLLPTYATSLLSLTPQGREIDAELAWHGRLWGGDASTSVFYRTDPGNFASLPDDKGVAVKWAKRF
ncbi:S8 family peptidase [Altererythrobacter sp. TH136]|uniref:S8 family peptidase n=1 Tax=Altererythrobacter sp. TH136 TaxID=2067415 RepID=UPI0011625551|nr:S8 family peptidase [Altererythrobacter sp. TH136]QDM41764.1 S8 family serine peptidase [Altererythrobacter sp. TH136]